MRSGERQAWRFIYPRWRVKKITFRQGPGTTQKWGLFPPGCSDPISTAYSFHYAQNYFPEVAKEYLRNKGQT